LRSISSLSVRRTNCVDTPPHIDYSTPKAVNNHDESIGVSNFQPPEEGPIDSQVESTDSPCLTGVIWRPLPVTYSLLHRDLVKERNLEIDKKMNLDRYIRTSQRRSLVESFYSDAFRAYIYARRAVLEPEFDIYLTEILTYLGTSTDGDLPDSVFNWVRLCAAFWHELELASTTAWLTRLFLAPLKGLLRRATEMFHGGQLDASKYRFLEYITDTWIGLPKGAILRYHRRNSLRGGVQLGDKKWVSGTGPRRNRILHRISKFGSHLGPSLPPAPDLDSG